MVKADRKMSFKLTVTKGVKIQDPLSDLPRFSIKMRIKTYVQYFQCLLSATPQQNLSFGQASCPSFVLVFYSALSINS